MKHNQHTSINKAALVASLTLLSASVSAAVNAPVKVEEAKQSVNAQLQQGLASFVEAEAIEQRYIVKFKNTNDIGGPKLKTKGGKKKMAGMPASQASDRAFDVLAAKSLVEQVGAKTHKVIEKQKMVAASMDKRTLNLLRKNPNVESVSVDARRKLMAQTTPYGYNMVQANQLSQNNTGARKVCIIDTGYNLGHPDLPDTNNGVTGEANNTAVGSWSNDGNGHGTHVAGTIAAYDNVEGVIGVYPGVSMHIVKIFDDSGSWTYASDLIEAINQCQAAGSNVVNMSLGGGSSSTAEQTAMQGFVDDGMMLVAAAGNDGNSTLSYPASYPAVMSVAAVDSSENHASYSQYNSAVEIAAPGSSVYSTYPTNSYATLNGTSMATPHVAGGAALVWSFFPQCSNEQIRSALNATAKDKGSAGRDNFYGNGLMQVADAYDYLNTNGCDGSGSGGGGGGGVEPVTGQLTNLSGSTGSWDRYTWDIPAGVQTMTVEISGGSGDADLYLRFGSQPSTMSYDCRPYKNGNNEVCTFTNPAAGTWHIGIRAYSSYSGVTMDYSYE
ncbi:S8 family serine peptidase [Alteromonas sp. ASW11-19]|uniref:S8 family serine peptidase n=1 Tax=Alteromonas salexigens TaxID=2982530 RepID=A0ABT2VMD4_9ALTE|nr:S8 family serine peptidase [Alteromonas salexigens]MCU7554478.1 S8 family serine peptidase [Alteromonas salexigens]